MIITKKQLKRRICEMYPDDEKKQTEVYDSTVTAPRLKWETILEKVRFDEKFGKAMRDSISSLNHLEEGHSEDDSHRTHNDSHAI